MRKVYYIWLREIKRYKRSRPRIVGSLGLPLLFLFALGFGLKSYLKIGGANYLEFILPGIVSMAVLMNSMMSGVSVIWDKQFGFLREMIVSPVSRTRIIIGKTLGGATTALIQGMLILLISIFMGIKLPTAGGFLLALVFMVMIGIAFSALGLCFASRMDDMEAFPLIMNFVIFPLFFLAGTLFPVKGQNIPQVLRVIAHLDPLTYGVDAVRFGLVGVSNFSLWLDFSVMIALCVLFVSAGSYLFQRIQM